MKWQRLGLIFDPSEHALPNGCREYAQSPQALVFEEFVRIYFSTRAVDKRGKYLSHVCFVDMAKSLRSILRVSEGTVIPLGGFGCFDEHGIFPMNVIRHGNRVYAYTCGWSRRESVSVDTSIGLAFSSDEGRTFQRHGTGPVVTSSLQEPFLVGDPFVQIIDGSWHMWYIYGVRWIAAAEADGTDARVYKIGHAVSSDGVNWRKDGLQLIADKLGPDECQALPTVISWRGRHHMFFCYRYATDFRTNKARSYRLGYACSGDLAYWARDDERSHLRPSPHGWDSEMMCYPHVFRCDGKVYLLYNGNEFGRRGFGAALLEEDA
jgi:hypothetical protein